MRLILIIYLMVVPTGLGALSAEEQQIPQISYYEKQANDKERELELFKEKMRADIAGLKMKHNVN